MSALTEEDVFYRLCSYSLQYSPANTHQHACRNPIWNHETEIEIVLNFTHISIIIQIPG